MRFMRRSIALLAAVLANGGNLPHVWGADISQACKDAGYVENLFDITLKQLIDESAGSIDATRTFHLCPDTTYEIDPSSFEFLYIFLPNVHILCGEDGNRSDNCIIKAGAFIVHSIFYPAPVDGVGDGAVRRLDNVVVRGVTFEFLGSTLSHYSAFIDVPGHVRFEDCRWNDNWALYLLRMGVFYALDDPQEDDSLKVEIIDCTIENGLAGQGILINFAEDLAVVNSDVTNYLIASNLPSETVRTNSTEGPINETNSLPEPLRDIIGNEQSETVFSSVIEQFGGDLEVSSSCFTNLQLRKAIIVAQSNIDFTYTNGIFDNLFGEGIIISDQPEEDACKDIQIETSEDVIECIAFDADICEKDNATAAPTGPVTTIAPTGAPTDAPTSTPCADAGYIEDLYSIFSQQLIAEQIGTIDETRTFILCPDTTFETNSDLEEFQFLYIFLPNVHILCGEDGKRSNNCIIKAGTGIFHTIMYPGLGIGDDGDSIIFGGGPARRLDNVVIRGVTFEFLGDPNSHYSAIVEVPGHIRFEDCHWNDNWAQYILRMGVAYDLEDPQEDDSLKVEIIDSTIENGLGGWGIFQNFGESLSVINTDIRDYDIVNQLPNDDANSFSSVFDQFGGELEVKYSCFENIQVTRAIIVAQGSTDIETDVPPTYTNGIFDNLFGEGNTITDDLEEEACGDIQIDTAPDVTECIAFDAAVCQKGRAIVPTPAPTDKEEARWSVIIDCFKEGTKGTGTTNPVHVTFFDWQGKKLGRVARPNGSNKCFQSNTRWTIFTSGEVKSVQVKIFGNIAYLIDNLRVRKNGVLVHHEKTDYCLSRDRKDYVDRWEEYVNKCTKRVRIGW